jgi:hypothetical protein
MKKVGKRVESPIREIGGQNEKRVHPLVTASRPPRDCPSTRQTGPCNGC